MIIPGALFAFYNGEFQKVGNLSLFKDFFNWLSLIGQSKLVFGSDIAVDYWV